MNKILFILVGLLLSLSIYFLMNSSNIGRNTTLQEKGALSENNNGEININENTMETLSLTGNVLNFSTAQKDQMLNFINNSTIEQRIKFFIQNDVFFTFNKLYYRNLAGGLGYMYNEDVLDDEIMMTFFDCIIPRFLKQEPRLKSERKEQLYSFIKTYEKGDIESLEKSYSEDEYKSFKGILGVLIDFHKGGCDITKIDCKYKDVTLLREFVYASMLKHGYNKGKNSSGGYEQQIDLYVLCFLYKYSDDFSTLMNYVNQSGPFKLYDPKTQKLNQDRKPEIVNTYFTKIKSLLE